MSDIVKRLRMAMTVTEMERITREAADEIERLRAALKDIANGCPDPRYAATKALNQQKAVEK